MSKKPTRRGNARLFIASSLEALPVARALQENLEHDLECVVWDQRLFLAGTVLAEELLRKIPGFDFAAFVFAPDDKAIIRGTKKKQVRDNVLIEFGISAAFLGLDRTFIIAPSDEPELGIPADVLGLLRASYISKRTDKNLIAALAVASSQIRARVTEILAAKDVKVPSLSRIGFFGEFVDIFPVLLGKAYDVVLYFIHSRRWRENHDAHIRDFLTRPRTHLTVYLPDPKNELLIKGLQTHFDDGPHIPGFIDDAIRYFRMLSVAFPRRVRLSYYSTYPAYSFYKFDDELIIAMYPTTPVRRKVPAFRVNSHHPFGAFVIDDIAELEKNSRSDIISSKRI
jgi:hypothetical protein